MKWLNRSLAAVALGLAAVAPSPAADDKTYDVEVIRDQPYVAGADAHDRQKVDLYLPRGQKGFPVLLFLHGGGFSKGDRKAAADFGPALASRGIGVAAAGYRLVPDAKHPGQSQDAARAFVWLHRNIGRHGGDPGRLFIGGHSAGATLAALVGSDEQYLKEAGASLKDVRGVVALSGLYRIPEARAEIFGDEASRKKASPIGLAREGLPAFFIAWADADNPGRDKESKEFAEALEKAKVTVKTYEAKDRKHGTLFTQIKAGDPTGDEVIGFIRAQSRSARAAAAKE